MSSLPLYKDERELISKSISPKLKKRNNNVRLGVRLKQKYSKLKTEEVLSTDELGIKHPLNPDIDILYWSKDYSGEPVLNAVEVKYFRYGEKGLIRPPFYDGIGEAIVLCTYGVDYVHLWHFFDPEISFGTYYEYKNLISKMMNKIDIVNYKCELLRKPKEKLPNNKIDLSDAFIDMISALSEPTHIKSNILRYDENFKTIRTLIKRSYRIVNR